MSLEGWLATLLASSLLGSLFASTFYTLRTVDLLQARHPAVWHALGVPDRAMATSVVLGFGFYVFLARREYRALCDPQLNHAASRALVLRGVSVGSFIACIVAAAVGS